jgi:hypothetical protein
VITRNHARLFSALADLWLPVLSKSADNSPIHVSVSTKSDGWST